MRRASLLAQAAVLAAAFGAVSNSGREPFPFDQRHSLRESPPSPPSQKHSRHPNAKKKGKRK